MTAFFQSPFLSALGWALANSLWQMALLWLLFQICFGINKKISPKMTYLGALVFMLGGFVWFAITFAQQYAATSSINQYLANLPQVDDTATTVSATGTFGLGAILTIGEKYLPFLSASYLIILVILFIRLINAYGYSQEVKTRGLIKIDYNWRIFVKDFANRIGIRREVAIYLSELIDVPATMGWLKPVILLPVATFTHLSPAQVEAVILHELSHIRRNDYLVNLLISVVETILFFNPFCQLLASTIRKERENCCDDFVIQLRCDPGSYAAALLSLEKMRVSNQQQLAIAATGNKNQLVGRVKRILNVKSKRFNYGQKITALLLTAFILSSLAWLSPDEKSKPVKDAELREARATGTSKMETLPAVAEKRVLAQQNILRRKMATVLPKNKLDFAPFEHDVVVSDMDRAFAEPHMFAYKVPDSFKTYSKGFFENQHFKIDAPEWNVSNFFGTQDKVQEAMAEADRVHRAMGHPAEGPAYYYSIPPGTYDLSKVYGDSELMKSYNLARDLYSNQHWNQAADQLQLKIDDLSFEFDNLSKDQADLAKAIFDIQLKQNGIEKEIIDNRTANGARTFQRDSANFQFQYNINTDEKKMQRMNTERLRALKQINEQQMIELKKQLVLVQGQAISDMWKQKAKSMEEDHQRMMNKAKNMQYNEYLQQINPGHGEYQERTETQQRLFRQGMQRKMKISAEQADQEMRRAYEEKIRSLEDYKEKLDRQQNRKRESADQMQKSKKAAEDQHTVLDVNGDYKIVPDGQTVLYTSSNPSVKSNNVQLVFTLNSNCVEPAGQNTTPVILTVKGISKAVNAKTEAKIKEAIHLQAIDL